MGLVPRPSVDGQDHVEWWFERRHESFIDSHTGEVVRSKPWLAAVSALYIATYRRVLRASIDAMHQSPTVQDGMTAGSVPDDPRSWEILLYRFANALAGEYVHHSIIMSNAISGAKDRLVLPARLRYERPATYRDFQRKVATSHSALSPLVAVAAAAELKGSQEVPVEVILAPDRRIARSFNAIARTVRGRRLREVETLLRTAIPSPPDVVLMSPFLDPARMSTALWGAEVRRFPTISSELLDLECSPSVVLPTSDGALGWLVARLLPSEYLLGYPTLMRMLQNSGHPRPRKAVVASFLPDVAHQAYVIDAVRNGRRFVLLQHGSAYGLAADHAYSDIEISIADSFGAWGWSEVRAHRKTFDIPMARDASRWPEILARPMSLRGSTRMVEIRYVVSDPFTSARQMRGSTRRVSNEADARTFLQHLRDIHRMSGVLHVRPRGKGRYEPDAPEWAWHLGARVVEGARELWGEEACKDVVVLDSLLTTVLPEVLVAGNRVIVAMPDWRDVIHESFHYLMDRLEHAGLLFECFRSAADRAVEIARMDPAEIDGLMAAWQPLRRRIAGVDVGLDGLRRAVLGSAILGDTQR